MPAVLGRVQAQRGAHAERGHREGEGVGVVDRPRHLRRAAGEVRGQAVARDRQRHVQLHRRAAHPVGVHVVRERVSAVRPARDLGAHEPLGVVDQVGRAGAEGVGSVAAHQLVHGALAGVAGRHLRAQVTEGHLRDAHVDPDHRQQRLVRLAAAVQLQPRDAQPVLEDLGVVARRAARQPPAQVEVVGGGHGVGDARSLPVDGLDDEDVGDVHPALEGVVEDEHVAGLHVVAVPGEQRLHRERHRAQVQGDGHSLRDHPAFAVAERRGVVQAVAHDRRVGGAVERDRHLVGGGGQRVLHDLARDRVYAVIHHGRASSDAPVDAGSGGVPNACRYSRVRSFNTP